MIINFYPNLRLELRTVRQWRENLSRVSAPDANPDEQDTLCYQSRTVLLRDALRNRSEKHLQNVFWLDQGAHARPEFEMFEWTRSWHEFPNCSDIECVLIEVYETYSFPHEVEPSVLREEYVRVEGDECEPLWHLPLGGEDAIPASDASVDIIWIGELSDGELGVRE